MHRFFVNKEQVGDKQIVITGVDVNHIRNVLRMQEGNEITVCDDKGTEYTAVLNEIGKEQVIAEIVQSCSSESELPVKLYLFQGLPKSDKMEWIIQKAVELGVYSVIPVMTKYSIVKMDTKKEESKRKRWQGIAESAAKQAKRGMIPEIGKTLSFQSAIQKAGKLGITLIPYEKAVNSEQTKMLVQSMKGQQSAGIFIGPEGGFASEEIEMAIEAGIEPITLGKRILRTETAGLAVLAIIGFELE